jgi:predicted CopG family antitoxin
MSERINKKDLHIRIDPEVYEKLRQITFYEQRTYSELVNRLLIEYIEEKATDEPDFAIPRVL